MPELLEDEGQWLAGSCPCPEVSHLSPRFVQSKLTQFSMQFQAAHSTAQMLSTHHLPCLGEQASAWVVLNPSHWPISQHKSVLEVLYPK